jgi:hypothetical protein
MVNVIVTTLALGEGQGGCKHPCRNQNHSIHNDSNLRPKAC